MGEILNTNIVLGCNILPRPSTLNPIDWAIKLRLLEMLQTMNSLKYFEALETVRLKQDGKVIK